MASTATRAGQVHEADADVSMVRLYVLRGAYLLLIVGLYSINRFKGEGVGERLVSRLLAEALQRGLSYVFACAVDERAKLFFARQGFEPGVFLQGYCQDTHGISDTLLSIVATRSAEIVRALADRLEPQ